MASTVAENKELLRSLLDCEPCTFKPSVPHLVSSGRVHHCLTAVGAGSGHDASVSML